MKHGRSLWQRFRNQPLQRKLTMTFAVILMAAIAMIMTGTYRYVSERFEDTITHDAGLSFEQAHSYIEQTVWPMIYASDNIYYDSTIQETLQRHRENPGQALDDQIRDMQRMQTQIKLQYREEQSISVRLYVDSEYAFSDQDVYFGNMADIRNEYDIRPGIEKEIFFWIEPQELVLWPGNEPARVVSLLRGIRNMENYAEIMGVIRVSILADRLDAILTNASITREGVVYIRNAAGEIIAASDHERAARLAEKPNSDAAPDAATVTTSDTITDTTLDAAAEETGWNWVNNADGSYLKNRVQIEQTDWELYAFIPRSEIVAASRRLMSFLLLFAGMVFSAGIAGIYLFSRGLSKRMHVLAKQMVSVRSGNLNITLENDTEDEVGILYESFDYMLTQIRILMQHEYENGIAIKNAELKTLQAQINPHFLYNTLDLINWHAMETGDEEVSGIARKLAKFYKLSLSNGADTVRLRDELEHAAIYVQIQNYRFEDAITLQVDIPDEMMDLKMPKLILQPIVENAIQHGILRSADRHGTITITGRRDGAWMELIVRDDGMGMDEASLAQILDEPKTDAGIGHGYGVYNTHLRLQLAFGESYGLRYESTWGEGTAVHIHMAVEPMTGSSEAGAIP